MFFYKVLTPISTTSDIWSSGNTRKYQQIDTYIYQCEIVRAEENLKMSYSGPSQSQASDTNQQIKALPSGLSLSLTPAIKEETMAINHDLVYKQACHLNLLF